MQRLTAAFLRSVTHSVFCPKQDTRAHTVTHSCLRLHCRDREDHFVERFDGENPRCQWQNDGKRPSPEQAEETADRIRHAAGRLLRHPHRPTNPPGEPRSDWFCRSKTFLRLSPKIFNVSKVPLDQGVPDPVTTNTTSCSSVHRGIETARRNWKTGKAEKNLQPGRKPGSLEESRHL